LDSQFSSSEVGEVRLVGPDPHPLAIWRHHVQGEGDVMGECRNEPRALLRAQLLPPSRLPLAVESDTAHFDHDVAILADFHDLAELGSRLLLIVGRKIGETRSHRLAFVTFNLPARDPNAVGVTISRLARTGISPASRYAG